MKFLYQDLASFFSEKPSKDLLSDRLFQLGHEHEIDDDIFDMELTPNRGDCLSLAGLSRDLHCFFGSSGNIEIYDNEIEDLNIDFENLAPDQCPQISFLEIEIDDHEKEYLPYLENYFSKLGNNKTNFFTDISNYISYELGQPTHCFDRDSIKGRIVFNYVDCNQTFKTLLGNDIKLKDKNCIFSVNQEIISLAGIMGGLSTACTRDTKKVLVECAFFNPESIIGKGVKYNLISDAAYKFERGVNVTSQETVLRRFIKVVNDHSRVKEIRLKKFVSNPYEYTYLPIDIDKVNKILGTKLNKDDYLDYLKNLGFEITDKIKVPSYRHDIKTQNDLAEEISRVIGYNNIDSNPIKINEINSDQKLDKTFIIRSFLTNNGFFEVINFPFTSIKEEDSLSLDNPLDSNRRYLRTSLKSSLIENLLYNERRQKDSLKLFEISDIYKKNNVIKQEKKLGIIVSGRLGNNFNDFSKKLDDAYLEKLLSISPEHKQFKVSEISRKDLDSKRKDPIFYIEVSIKDIPESFFSEVDPIRRNINFISYVPISEFPSSTRDFSFSIINLEKVDEVLDHLNKFSDKIIKDSYLFDFYKNNKTNTIKIGYRFVFQSSNKTLSDIDINKKVDEILKPILMLDGVSIPGM